MAAAAVSVIVMKGLWHTGLCFRTTQHRQLATQHPHHRGTKNKFQYCKSSCKCAAVTMRGTGDICMFASCVVSLWWYVWYVATMHIWPFSHFSTEIPRDEAGLINYQFCAGRHRNPLIRDISKEQHNAMSMWWLWLAAQDRAGAQQESRDGHRE